MSKIGYFLTGVIAGATALAAAAFLVDERANAPLDSDPDEELERVGENPSAEPSGEETPTV